MLVLESLAVLSSVFLSVAFVIPGDFDPNIDRKKLLPDEVFFEISDELRNQHPEVRAGLFEGGK
jgi:hypothetical protein